MTAKNIRVIFLTQMFGLVFSLANVYLQLKNISQVHKSLQ